MSAKKKEDAQAELDAVQEEQDKLAEEIKAAQSKAAKEVREKKESEARDRERRRLEVERIEKERELAELRTQELEAALNAEKQKLLALEVPPGYVLCTIRESAQTGADYHILVSGKSYRFKAPEYLCALPEELANKYENTPHPIMIRP
jgi:vacuolar-type H+-ATPase subunit E/Vma4